jgi:rod shape-determining protein MreC
MFLKRIYVLLLFIIIEVAAIRYYAASTSFTKAKILSSANDVLGVAYKQFSSIGDYFGLRSENDALINEIVRLRNEYETYRTTHPDSVEMEFDGAEDVAKYIYTSAGVVNNSISGQNNFITLDKGRMHGVEPNMAIVTPEGGIVGYVLSCSDKFSVGISVLNTRFRTGGKIKGSNNFGSVSWDGRDHAYVTLSEIPKYAEISQGDTIVTDFSSIFPPDVTIGTVESYRMTQSSYYDVQVKLSTRMGALKRVMLVRYADIVERMSLEEEVSNANK